MMGSGAGNGFSIVPDLTTFCLLQHWQDDASKKQFFNDHEYWNTYRARAKHHLDLDLLPLKVRGSWDQRNPFPTHKPIHPEGKIAVLTRATIKKRFIPKFWSQVPMVSRPVRHAKGHIFSKGVGELPLFLQATVSVWESKEDMYNYAYRNRQHLEMIKKTRELGWYKEELFAEFLVLNFSKSA